MEARYPILLFVTLAYGHNLTCFYGFLDPDMLITYMLHTSYMMGYWVQWTHSVLRLPLRGDGPLTQSLRPSVQSYFERARQGNT